MRRVSLNTTILVDGKPATVPREVWPLRRYSSGYIISRGGIATARYGRHYKSTGLLFLEGNRKEAIRIAEAWVSTLKKAPTPATPVITQLTWARAWVQYELDLLQSPETPGISQRERARWILAQRTYKDFVKDGGVNPVTDAAARELTSVALQRYRERGLSASRIQDLALSWGQFLRYCRGAGWLAVDPLALVRLPKREKKEVRTYTERDLDRLYAWAAARDPALEMLWRFLVGTSCRISEALALRWADISLDQGFLDFPVTKGDFPRPFPLGPFPEVVEVLRGLQGISFGERVFPWEDSEDTLLLLKNALRELHIAAGLRPQHTFRATADRLWKARGISAELRARLAGHSVQVMIGNYDARSTAKELEQLLRG